VAAMIQGRMKILIDLLEGRGLLGFKKEVNGTFLLLFAPLPMIQGSFYGRFIQDVSTGTCGIILNVRHGKLGTENGSFLFAKTTRSQAKSEG
jgi:hypothetical protein